MTASKTTRSTATQSIHASTDLARPGENFASTGMWSEEPRRAPIASAIAATANQDRINHPSVIAWKQLSVSVTSARIAPHSTAAARTASRHGSPTRRATHRKAARARIKATMPISQSHSIAARGLDATARGWPDFFVQQLMQAFPLSLRESVGVRAVEEAPLVRPRRCPLPEGEGKGGEAITPPLPTCGPRAHFRGRSRGAGCFR